VITTALPDRRILDLFGVDLPIILAPKGGRAGELTRVLAAEALAKLAAS
jgi:hypothetical protein